jgi:hypothetical protein
MPNKSIRDIIEDLRSKRIIFYDEYPYLTNGTRLTMGYKHTLEGWALVHEDTRDKVNGYFLVYQPEDQKESPSRSSVTDTEFLDCQQACYEQAKRW